MKAFELDRAARLAGSTETQINKLEVAFRLTECCYYEISWDESAQNLIIRKAGFPDDKITIVVEGANKITVK